MGEWQGLLAGFTLGATHFVFFGAYALALWFGSQRVADGESDGGKVRLGADWCAVAQSNAAPSTNWCSAPVLPKVLMLTCQAAGTPASAAGGVCYPGLRAGRLCAGTGARGGALATGSCLLAWAQREGGQCCCSSKVLLTLESSASAGGAQLSRLCTRTPPPLPHPCCAGHAALGHLPAGLRGSCRPVWCDRAPICPGCHQWYLSKWHPCAGRSRSATPRGLPWRSGAGGCALCLPRPPAASGVYRLQPRLPSRWEALGLLGL